ncbi:MAG: hypothetical protein Q4B69_05855 [Slackia sp.]|nr:hypothetical protein [Slackia sp.]
MQATSDQIIGLTKLQHVDLSIAQLARGLDALPQKQKIADVRAKRRAIEQKREALASAREQAESQLACLRSQDDAEAGKAVLAQQAIEAASGDYRVVSARSEELDEIAQRREGLAARIDEISSRLAEIAGMEPQIGTMLARLDEREAELVEAYRREGGAILAKKSELERERRVLAETIGAPIMDRYERIAQAKQGVALCHLVDGACNTCRAHIDPSRVLILRSEYPLSLCPHCGRLMVVDRRYAG